MLVDLVVSGCAISDITGITSLERLTRISCNGSCVDGACMRHVSTRLHAVRDLVVVGPSVGPLGMSDDDIAYCNELCPRVSITYMPFSCNFEAA